MPATTPHNAGLVACPDCDQLQRLPSIEARQRVRCVRCGCLLHGSSTDPVAVPLALGVTALILFVLSNSFPLLQFGYAGRYDATYLLAGIQQLYLQQAWILATVVLLTTFIVPLLHIVLLVYIYLPLQLKRRPPGFVKALRAAQALWPWSMLEIFLLGVIVASVKLAEQATIVPGPAAWSLGLLVMVLAAATSQVHPQKLWERVT
jgi:paraquat-inducible protein A